MTLIDQLPAPPRVKRWTKAEYYDAVDRGVFRRHKRVFLYRGELVEMAAMGSLHAIGATNLEDWLHDTFRPQFRVRVQKPFELPDQTVPEPDAAVVTPEQAGRLPHPNAAVLVVEVADSSVELDREMALDYASARVPEYWLLNVRDRNVEVFREPVADPASPTKFRYASHVVVDQTGSLSPLARPDRTVAVSTFLAR